MILLRKIFLCLLFLVLLPGANFLRAQQLAENVFWLTFTDKNNNGFSYEQPSEFLSERSINRRAWQGLGVDQADEPVTRAYVDSLISMGFEVRHVSRWLNGVVLVNTPFYKYKEALELNFVDTLPWRANPDLSYVPPKPGGLRFEAPLEQAPSFRYGLSLAQVKQLELRSLHQEGYTGKGVWIGLLDAGFRNVDTLPAFAKMISEGRLLGTRNFVSDTSVFRLVNNHGMYVLSITGADWDGNLVGTAPHASYFLCSTEDTWKETKLEEISWIAGAEFLDSLGVDVFNTSLGYSEFDDGLFDYRYEDMDGKSTFISRAASMAASRGIISSNSAGNEGNHSWYRITAPADARDILSVAAADSFGRAANFSSRGPSYDGRLTPNVTAMGVNTGLQYQNGGLGRGSGTSFSSPLIAGAAACLWQAFPQMTAREVILKMTQAGDRALNPDATYGYGIPRLRLAYWPSGSGNLLSQDAELRIYPNPASERISLSLPGEAAGMYRLIFFDISGRESASIEVILPGEIILPESLGAGMIILEVRSEKKSFRGRFVRQ